MEVIVNNHLYDDIFIKGLNESYPNKWGDKQLFEWVFKNNYGVREPDIFVLKDNDSDYVTAGGAVFYRLLSIPEHDNLDVSIGGSVWTLPEYRGRGLYIRLVEESLRLCRTHNIPFHFAHVTDTNVTNRKFRSLGASDMPTFNIVSVVDIKSQISIESEFIPKEIEIDDDSILYCYTERERISKDKIHYIYTYEQFKTRFFEKKAKLRLLKLNDSIIYLLLEKDNVFQILFTNSYLPIHIDAVLKWSLERGKNIFFFQTKLDSCFSNNPNYKSMKAHQLLLKSSDDYSQLFNEFNNLEYDWEMQYGDKT